MINFSNELPSEPYSWIKNLRDQSDQSGVTWDLSWHLDIIVVSGHILLKCKMPADLWGKAMPVNVIITMPYVQLVCTLYSNLIWILFSLWNRLTQIFPKYDQCRIEQRFREWCSVWWRDIQKFNCIYYQICMFIKLISPPMLIFTSSDNVYIQLKNCISALVMGYLLENFTFALVMYKSFTKRFM